MMSTLSRISRIVTGLIFVFSGFVKGIDPMGTAFKIGDYLTAFGMEWLDGIAVPLSILLCLIEFVTGMMLITGSMVTIASWIAALFMALFTPLTLVLAIYNPVSDCGCFGDAVVLTNWQTFFKNIAITLLVVFVFARRRDRTAVLPVMTGLNATLVFIFIFLLFMRYNLACLPVIDFRPYSTGTNLPEAMAVPPDAEPNKYDIRFIYEKDGLQQEFTLNDYPADDTTWKFIDQKSVLISKGYVPPIRDFTLVTEQGLDMTDQVTGQPGDVMLMIARDLAKSDRDGLARGYDLGLTLQNQGVRFYIITATPPYEARDMVTGFDALYADEITLKTVIRSDPGFVLLHNGTITGKWSYQNLPDTEEFSGDLNALAMKTQTKRSSMMVTVIAILTVLLAVAVTLPFSLKERNENKKIKQ
ncbi:MAG: DoxX family protein [Bacteroidales bacterium]|nr:DoxX family protein [Bacteroidales bacterium]MDT8372797.1 DoxX family protein [Bacteroidales bacterium]